MAKIDLDLRLRGDLTYLLFAISASRPKDFPIWLNNLSQVTSLDVMDSNIELVRYRRSLFPLGDSFLQAFESSLYSPLIIYGIVETYDSSAVSAVLLTCSTEISR